VIFSPSFASASALSLARIIAEISGGLNAWFSPPTFDLDVGVAVGASTTL
jgi:hypothetical protein